MGKERNREVNVGTATPVICQAIVIRPPLSCQDRVWFGIDNLLDYLLLSTNNQEHISHTKTRYENRAFRYCLERLGVHFVSRRRFRNVGLTLALWKLQRHFACDVVSLGVIWRSLDRTCQGIRRSRHNIFIYGTFRENSIKI